MIILGIAGKSGSGKSTLAYWLKDHHSDQFEVLNFDDYQKKPNDQSLPRFEDRINWDHPDAIEWPRLQTDLVSLKLNETITINSWAHRSNPDYALHRRMVSRTIKPHPILLLEGYLVFYSQAVRNLLDRAYFLDLPSSESQKRRDKTQVINDSSYDKEILLPMQKMYVSPSAHFADLVIKVRDMTTEETANRIIKDILLNFNDIQGFGQRHS